MKKIIPLLLLATIMIGCSSTTTSHEATYQIRYEVTGDVDNVTMIQYVDVDSGGLVTLQDVDLPWSTEVTAGEWKIALSAYATTGKNMGWINANIYKDGQLWATDFDTDSQYETLSVLAEGDLRD